MSDPVVAMPDGPPPAESGRSRLAALASLAKQHPRAVFGILVAGYLVMRVSILFRFTVFLAYDTSSYSKRPGSTDQVETLSFAGNAPRPWGAPLLYTLAGNDTAAAVLQQLVGTIAWVVVAFAAWAHLRSMVARVVAVALIFGLSLSPAVYPWDFAILSESLSINLGLLSAGLFVIWLRYPSKITLAVAVLSGLWWTFTRQDILPFVALLVASLAVIAWRRRGLRFAAALAVVSLVAGIGWHLSISSNINNSYANWGFHLKLSEGTFLYRIRFLVLPDRKVAAYYHNELGMPHCPTAERIAAGRAWKMSAFVAAYKNCPELMAWQEKHGVSSGYEYALRQPKSTVKIVTNVMPDSLRGPVRPYGKPVRLIPKPLESAYFWALQWGGIVLLLGMAVAAMFRVRMGVWRRRGWFLAGGLMLSVVSVANVALTTLYTAGEYSRFGIQEAVFLRVGTILILIGLLDAFMTRREAREVVGAARPD